MMRCRLNKRLMIMKEGEKPGEGDSLVEVLDKKTYSERHHASLQEHMLMRSMEHPQYCKVDLLRKCDIGTFVFVDEEQVVDHILRDIEKTQVMEKNFVAHLFFEFLEYLIRDDVVFLQGYEERLMDMEAKVMEPRTDCSKIPGDIMRIRRELSKLCSYYTQLMNMSDSLSENYNNLLREEDCSLFKLYSDRIVRLVDMAKDLKDYAYQIREMYQSSLDEAQNNAISFLTVVTTIFMPLTLIAGWYGMNFKWMPELNTDYGYFICFAVSILLIIGETVYFKKKGWLKK